MTSSIETKIDKVSSRKKVPALKCFSNDALSRLASSIPTVRQTGGQGQTNAALAQSDLDRTGNERSHASLPPHMRIADAITETRSSVFANPRSSKKKLVTASSMRVSR